MNLGIRWFTGYALHEALPDHSSLTRIRQRWGVERFRQIFERTVRACIAAKIASGEILHVDASLILANVSWESLAVRHVEAVSEVDGDAVQEEAVKKESRQTGRYKKILHYRPGRLDGDQWQGSAARAGSSLAADAR